MTTRTNQNPKPAPDTGGLADAQAAAPKLPLTVSEAAALWGCSTTTVKRLIAQGRVKADRRGGGGTRGGTVLVWQLEKPDRLAPGSLTPAQREAWNKGKRKKADKASVA